MRYINEYNFCGSRLTPNGKKYKAKMSIELYTTIFEHTYICIH